jgi:3-oxoacyl-[acyl-carrier-protein] synthase II
MVPAAEFAAWRHAAGIDAKRNSPFMAFALAAASEAVEDAGLDLSTPEARRRTGVALGAGMSRPCEIAEAGAAAAEGRLRRLSPFFVPRILNNMAAGAVGIRLGLQGPNHAVSTACATGVHAIGDAFRMIQRGDADAMLAGGSEACIDAVSLGGFSRLRALSTAFNGRPEAASRPFDAERDGFVIGEGAGVLVLEEAGAAAARGARVYAEVRGYGLSGDGHHITQPHPEGEGAALAMARALAGSGVPLEAVAYLNAHATSTPMGDEIEQAAVLRVFGPQLAAALAVSSTKGATGHLLGAAGAVEAAFTVLALARRRAPTNVNLVTPSPHLLRGLVMGPDAAALRPGPAAALCNSFGFGGTNACVLFASDGAE